MLVVTGQRRQALDHFVVAFGVDTHSSSDGTASSSDPVLQVCVCSSVPMTAFRMQQRLSFANALQQHPCLQHCRKFCIASKYTPECFVRCSVINLCNVDQVHAEPDSRQAKMS